jgi:NTP pyrophosphatase (non-canonical NTP hydrolase)
MDSLQKRIDDYYKNKGWEYWNQHQILARLTEEVGELAREINHQYGPKKKKSDELDNSIQAEVGDILYTLACLANQEGISLEVAFKQSIEKVEARDGGRFNKSNE